MLTLVEVTNVRSDTLRLALMDTSNGYSVKEIDGLDPVTATLTTSTMAQMDGAQFQNAQRGTRNITVKLGLEPDFVTNTVQSLRSALYTYFMPKANVAMNFYLDNVLFVTTSGQVESCENAMFSADPEVDISIICYDPDFYAPEAITIDTDTVSTTTVQTISYPGNSETGFIFTLNIDRTLAGFALYNTSSDNSIQVFTVVGSFISGDVVTINTNPGSRGMTLNRAGLVTSIMYYTDTSSSWPVLQNGNNFFRAYAAGDAIPCTLVYTPRYGGI